MPGAGLVLASGLQGLLQFGRLWLPPLVCKVAFYLNPVQRLPMLLHIRNALIGMERLEEMIALPQEQARVTQAVALPPVQGRRQS